MIRPIRTVLQEFDEELGGFVAEDEEGEPVCFLNARHTREKNQQTYIHELQHLWGGDLQKEVDVNELEKIRHE